MADQTGVDRAFDRNVARVAIVIERGYADAIAAGRKGQVAVLIDGSEPNSAQLGQAYAVALNNTLTRQTLVRWAESRGQSLAGVGFLVPGLMVVIVMIVTVQQTSVTLVRERESGTLEQMMESPLREPELILGKVLPWALLGFIDTVLITAVSLGVFRVPLRGDVIVLGVGMFLFIVCSLSIGLVISAVSPSIESANLIGLMISFLPGFMLSGLAFPLGSIPFPLQVVSCLFPGRYMIEIARGVFLRGTSWDVLGIQILWLAIYAAIGLGLATELNRRREQA